MSISKQKPCVKAIVYDAQTQRTIKVRGKPARVLKALVFNGSKGVTALELSNTWAVRLSEYISVLRHDYGLEIETVKESHYDGWHGRYMLHSYVEIILTINF